MNSIEIRSYRTVFDLERRIYRIDRLRLNPTGVPVRALLYAATLCAGAVLISLLPLLGSLVRLVPWYIRDLLGPVAGAGIFTMIRVEGRPFHLAAWALLRHAIGPRQLVGLRRGMPIGERWYPSAIVILPDGSDGRLRRLRCQGPGVVLVAPAHERIERELGLLARLGRRPQLVLSELSHHRAPGEAQPIALTSNASMLVQ